MRWQRRSSTSAIFRTGATMNARVMEATEGARGFDTATPLSAMTCKALAVAGIKFAIRYVSFREPKSRDLSAPEVETILEAGLALMVVQHVRNPGWTPSGAMGTADGQRAVANTSAVGVLTGVCVW